MRCRQTKQLVRINQTKDFKTTKLKKLHGHGRVRSMNKYYGVAKEREREKKKIWTRLAIKEMYNKYRRQT